MEKTLRKLTALTLCILLALSCCLPGFTAAAAEGEEAETPTYTAPTNLPAMYVNLENNFPQENIDKENWVPASISLVGAEGYDDLIEVAGNMKGRGNYSWSAEKKPYGLKFNKKTDLLGMGKAKKWVLIANYWDKTMLRNYITLTLAADMGLKYTTEVRFIDLYVNGVYRGNYLLTEKVEIGKERVNIDDENGGVLFEIEQEYRHNSECDYCHQTPSGVHLTYKEPEYESDEEGEIFNTAFIQNMMNTMNPILDTIDASLSQGYDAYSKYIDVQSFVDWYILNEFTKNYDSQFVTSCYCYYDPKDGLLHMGPAWDYDTCYGNQSGDGYGVPEGYLISTGSPWYRMLMSDESFLKLVKERWTELKANGTIYSCMQNILNGSKLIAASQVLNNEAWPNMLLTDGPRGGKQNVYYTYKEEVDYLRKFVAMRTLWLDEEWNVSPETTANKLDNINMIAGGLLLDNSMAIDDSYFTKAYELYTSLSDEEKATLSDEINRMLGDYEVFAVESAIKSAAAITSYTQKSIVENARRLYESLSEEKKAQVTNYADLLAAEAKLLALAAEMGIANVSQNEITSLVEKGSVTAPTGFGGEGVDKLFDGLTSTKYCVGFQNSLTIAWEMAQPAAVSVYALATANDSPERTPKAWKLEGSNDGESWTLVDQVDDAAMPETYFTYKEFFADAPAVYSQYRMTITATAGQSGVMQFSELLVGGSADEAVEAVIRAIDAIGPITSLEQKAAVAEARAAYDALDSDKKVFVNNYASLVAAEVAILKLEGGSAAPNAVIAQIDALGEITSLDSREAVGAARTAYDALTDAEKTMVTNYDALLAAEEAISTLQKDADDRAAAAAVDALIDAIGEVVSKEQAEAIQAARAAYRALTPKQKSYVEKLAVLVAAETALGQIDLLPNVLETIGSIGDPVTHRDGPTVRKARELYDALPEADRASVTNYAALTAAETALQALYDAFDVQVRFNTERSTFSTTPWMDFSKLSEAQQTATASAMAEEIAYQYKQKGYQMGLTKGVYQTSNHGGYLIVQSDVHVLEGEVTYTDNVGNPWGSEGRYWSCVIAPFSGTAFSVNGYLSSSDYGYEMPLCDSFVYDGHVYQVYSTGVTYHEDIALVRDTNPAFATYDFYPGSGDAANNNTFAYAYAKYAQENKWAGKVLGIPYGNVEITADGTAKYQRFYSADGDAYILAATETVAAADGSSAAPEGAYTLTGKMLEAFLLLGETDAERLAVTGAAVSNAEETEDGYWIQQFEKGVLVVLSDSSYFVRNEEYTAAVKDAADFAAAAAALPELEAMDADDYASALALKQKYDAFSALTLALLSSDAVQRMKTALTWTKPLILGDMDGDGFVTVSDVVLLRQIIIGGAPTEEECKRGDLTVDGVLTVSDVVALRGLIVSGG